MRPFILVTSLLVSATAAAQGAPAGAKPQPPQQPQPFLPLGEGEAIIFCPETNCKVAFTLEDGTTQQLAVGTKVKFIDNDVGAGRDGSPAKATITLGGKKGKVPNVNLIIKEALNRSPNGQAAVFFPIVSCGDFCHSEIWLLTPSTWAQLEGADALQPAVAWDPQGKRVVIGAWGLFTVELTGMRMTRDDTYYAPAYSPDGTLFVRARADDAVYRVEPSGALKKLGPPPKGKKPKLDEGEADDPISPVTFSENGRVVIATFRRFPTDVVTSYNAR